MGNVTGHHGKHFMVSRQTLHLMAFHQNALLLTMPGFNSLACGGIVLLPTNDTASQRGKKTRCTCFHLNFFHLRIITWIAFFWFAVQCRKPWDYLAFSFMRSSRRVTFDLAGISRRLTFTLQNYTTEFGEDLGTDLYFKLSEVLEDYHQNSDKTDIDARMDICIVIWKRFGIEWTKSFRSIQESRQVSPPKGAEISAVLCAMKRFYLFVNIIFPFFRFYQKYN